MHHAGAECALAVHGTPTLPLLPAMPGSAANTVPLSGWNQNARCDEQASGHEPLNKPRPFYSYNFTLPYLNPKP
jgi:hypothetical protein